MENKVRVYIKVWGEGKIPQYASNHAAGCDLFATMDMAIRPGETRIMPLDFSMAIDTGLEAQIRPRSGLSVRTELRIPNSPGTIDSDYRDTVGIIIQNTYNIANLPYQVAVNPELLDELRENYEEVDLGTYLGRHCGPVVTNAAPLAVLGQKIYIDRQGNPYGTIYIKKGERIAQMVFCEHKRAEFVPHPDPRSIGEDRGGGFGHTGSR
ncbi:MAG TPA: aminotransferase [Clostridiales bacterium]|nr:aminotransferase [Clostridiales bacterium]HPP35680.1 aminotransferase [Clostridiales bacterium]